MNHSISYSELRENLKANLDKVCEDHAPLLVTRTRGEDVVILSRADFASLEETAYLLRSPANAARLIAALKHTQKHSTSFPSLQALRDAIGME